MTHDWDDFGNETSSVGGADSEPFEPSYGGPAEEESEDEWLDQVMEEVLEEVSSDIASVRRTSEQMVEGEIDEDLWLTLDFQLSSFPGPGAAEGIMTVTIEGEGHSQTSEVEFHMDDPMSYVREDARDEIMETLELHPSSA
jgi:hypothetical protein